MNMANAQHRYEFVELERTFRELPQHVRESDKVDIDHVLPSGQVLKWADLILEHRVVLLSEAGSGKTKEIRNVAMTLRSEGKSAFFIRLENIPTDFEDAFEVGDFQQFQDWLVSGEDGWLFLDSVDEARLRHPRDFELAIRKLGSRVSIAKDRTHILITGRAHAWRPKADLALCLDHLPFASPNISVEKDDSAEDIDTPEAIETTRTRNGADLTFKLVTLDDLSPNQIETFVEARGVTDTKGFLKAVERSDAWSFTSRPQDLEELTDFWLSEGRIGSRLELMQNSIDRRLTERDQDRADASPLSIEDARQGARVLAAAATLTHEPTICVPDGTSSSTGIQARDLLPQWDEGKLSALLSRPIFDEAIYGTVRFHHRSVREYLTAEWILELIVRETSRWKIEALLFQNQYGEVVVVPTFRPVLPWLAIFDEKIRERLRRVAPEVILSGGDPSRLPLDTRRAVLTEVCRQMSSGAFNRSVEEYDAIQRFSNDDIVDDIRRLLQKHAGDDCTVGFLLRMVWLGEIQQLLPDAKRAAMSAAFSTQTRIDAVRAVHAVGSENDRDEVRATLIRDEPQVPRELLAELVYGLLPTRGNVDWLLAALAWSAEKVPHSIDRLSESIKMFSRSLATPLLSRFVSGLNNLLNRTPFTERRHCEVSTKFGWLLGVAAEAVERLIQERDLTVLEAAPLSLLYKLQSAIDYGIDGLRSEKANLMEIIPKWPELNRALFWCAVSESRARVFNKRGEALDEYWQAAVFGALWQFNDSDFDYAISQIDSQPLDDDRSVALSLAFRLYVDGGRPRAWRDKLKRCVASDAHLATRLSRYFRPPSQSEAERNSKRQEAAWQKREKARTEKERKSENEFKSFLTKNADKLRDPGFPDRTAVSNHQYHLHERMRQREPRSSRWTESRWELLIEEYDEPVARAFRDGAVFFWRRYSPQLLSEGAEPRETKFPVIFGLTGLNIEARETPGWPANLDDVDVGIACRYAVHELNGFPAWFARLFQEHSQIVSEFLLREIEYELSIAGRDEELHYVLSDLSWHGDWAWNEIAPALVRLLTKSEPKNLESLRKLLVIVQRSSISDRELIGLASAKCKKLRRNDHLALWYAAWTGVEPSSAIPAFSTKIAGMSRKKQSAQMAMSYVTSLLATHSNNGLRVREEFQTPGHLKELYLLMHKHIQYHDDIERIGSGAYSPEMRDTAQDARERLVGLLNQISGKDAYLALLAISRTHPDKSMRPWIRLQAKARAEQDADDGRWFPSQVLEFQASLERTPKTHRELSDLAKTRLLDLKDDIENGDSSIAVILRRVTHEKEMRNFIGREMREKAAGRYSVPQEEELADAKKPDLRFLGSGVDSPVPVELKLADRWTGSQLFERLKNQLCGDYLRDNRSSRGIYLLIHSGGKRSWTIPKTSKRVNFEGLISALEAYWAKKISAQFLNVEHIDIIGIDLTKRIAD